MTSPSRRRFLQASAGTLALPGAIRRALAVEPHSRSASIQDVEHVVILMQENRSFDHYFGHLRGVRGFSDRFGVTLAGGEPVWRQPRGPGRGGPVAPFRLDTTDPAVNAQCTGGLAHSWATTHAAINRGGMDRWVEQKTEMTMGYHVREDLPFHYALADAFTVCDQYFCSIPGNTHPNRMYLMTGMVDPTGGGGGPLLDNVDYVDNAFDSLKREPFTWTTYPERLERAGIDWRIYQQGTGFDEFSGNFGTNVLANFRAFVDAPQGSSLHRRAMTARTIAQLRGDVLAGRLPQVSWILPPAAFSEHPKWTPLYGAHYVASVLDALTADPRTWSRTVLFLTYDENDGFFDHVPPPQPATWPGGGASTVDITAERHDVVAADQAGIYGADLLPYGLGPRVPTIVVSPWTRGGWVCSQVFDHTSLIRFIENRFGVHEPNISPWRRAVCGDMTSAFDFARRDPSVPALPDTRGYRDAADLQCARPVAAGVPAEAAALPRQEGGTRPARALPYALRVSGRVGPSSCGLSFAVTGPQAAVFWVHDLEGGAEPRSYTVEPGKSLQDDWRAGPQSRYRLEVRGPNGFFRAFAGQSAGGAHAARAVDGEEDAGCNALRLSLRNEGVTLAVFVLRDRAYGAPSRRVAVGAGEACLEHFPLRSSGGWYDLEATVEGDPLFLRRLAGHVETGQSGTSDPAMGRRTAC